MTHIENIPHIMEHGIIHKQSKQSNVNYRPIGDTSLIETRDTFIIAEGKMLGDYIPFYLGARTPMLYVIQYGYNGVSLLQPDKIVYCISSIQRIIDKKIDFIYTDGHATDSFTRFYSSEEVENIENQVDFTATKVKFWKDENDLDLKRRKEAEFLIKKTLDFQDILSFVVYNENTSQKLLSFGIKEDKIAVRPSLYF